MTPEIFAEWLRRQGHKIFKSSNSYWYNKGFRVYQAFPYHWVIEPTGEELSDILFANGSVGLRYSTPVSNNQGCISYHAIFEDSSYGYDSLSKNARKNVRRGLRNCSVEPISFNRLANEGFDLQLDTLDRQGRKLDIDKKLWETRCIAANEMPGFEAWGAIVDKRLSASVITFQMDDCCYMLYQQCHRDYLRAHVNNALSFFVSKTMIERSKISSILYGLHSLDAPPSVDDFKFRMGYKAKPVRQRVVFNPLIKPFLNTVSHSICCFGNKIFPSNSKLSKVEGMLRFYLQGRQELTNQNWPEVLKNQKIPFSFR